jgi:hypothetical protein
MKITLTKDNFRDAFLKSSRRDQFSHEALGELFDYYDSAGDVGVAVKAGDIGGFIESEKNLSLTGDAWVYGNARVYGDAQVRGDARVYGNAQSWEN